MEFHHRGYESTNPRIRPAEGYGIDRSPELPEQVDVLIAGTGPAGVLLAAQLSWFPELNVRIIERRPQRLEIGQADGIQARSVETFEAFGFADEIINEAYQITETAFWKPNPEKPEEIVRTTRTPDDPADLSEYPHLVVNQARVLDYFIEAAQRAPGRIEPDYGIEFLDLEIDQDAEYPVLARLRHTAGPKEGQEFEVRAKYVVGGDGARSRVRKSIGHQLLGDAAMHAWGVLDVVATTDFPDIRLKSIIQSHDGGNILLIPREGGHLFRVYVDLGETPEGDGGRVRQTPIEEIIARANTILSPYSIDVKHIAWSSVYEVAHRLTDGFDDVPEAERGERTPRVFIMGDACHTHSAKAGQGMNTSMQDGFNLGWKLAHVLTGRASEALLRSYGDERRVTSQNLIDFDKEWSTLMATPADELPDPSALEEFYVQGLEFSNGFKTEYAPSLITAGTEHQALAPGFPVGRRFASAKTVRRSDSNVVHIGHLHRADGRWRIYAFADADHSRFDAFGHWLGESPESPVVRYTRPGGDADEFFDVKAIYPDEYRELDPAAVPEVFLPQKAPFGLVDTNKVFGQGEVDKQRVDIFAERGIGRDGAVVVVRPDQYVAAVLPLTATDELAAFFDGVLLPAGERDIS